MARRPYITPRLAARVARMVRFGTKTRTEIADACGISTTSVHRIARSLGADVPSSNGGRTKSTRWRYCDHPRTPENSMKSGAKWETCLTCKRERDKKRYINGPGTGNGEHPITIKRITKQMVQQFTPRPLPVVDNSGRSYEAFPRKYA